MKYFAAVAVLLVGGSARAGEPTFTVVNKMPPAFTVVNKMPAPAVKPVPLPVFAPPPPVYYFPACPLPGG
jgi:hypothetical protein